MRNLLLVMAGGAVGSGLRHLFGRWTLAALGPGYPWGTLGVNWIGGIAMGLLVGTLARTGGGEATRLVLAVGLLGGFTTFSAFSLDVVVMAERGDLPAAVLYVALSVLGAVGGVALGLFAMRSVAA